jgi:hypothetical protein
MAVKTQGSQLFALVPIITNPGTFQVLEIDCISNFNGGGNPADQIVVECLNKTTREYLKGMRTPGQATFTVDADPRVASHIRLQQAAESDDPMYDEIRWALGWADGMGIVPAVGAADGLASVSITAGGSGYTSPPTVAFTGGGGGTGAAGTAIISGGKVVGVNITNPGSGYTLAPTVAFTGGTGTGAAATTSLGDPADFVLPPTRTWFVFDGYVADFPFDFQNNSTVKTSAAIQRSGPGAWVRKAV